MTKNYLTTVVRELQLRRIEDASNYSKFLREPERIFQKILIEIKALTVVRNVVIEVSKLIFAWNHRYLSSFTVGVTYIYLTTL